MNFSDSAMGRTFRGDETEAKKQIYIDFIVFTNFLTYSGTLIVEICHIDHINEKKKSLNTLISFQIIPRPFVINLHI